MNWRNLALGSTLAATLVISGMSGSALAYCGCYAPGQAAAGSSDSVKIDEMRQAYDAKLTPLEAKLRATSRDLDQALIDEDSTKADELRQKLYELEGEYYTVRDQAWGEMNRAGATGNWGRSGWNCRWHNGHDGSSGSGRGHTGWNCGWHNDHDGWSGGRTAMNRWSGNRGSSCW